MITAPGATIRMSDRAGSRIRYRVVKRAFDVAFSAAVVVLGFVPGAISGVFVARGTGGGWSTD